MATTKEELKQLAELAAARGFEWIAQDGRNGVWYGYKIRPEYKEHIEEWVTGSSIECEPIQLPDTTDYSKQLFNVNELLTNEQ